MNSLSIDLVFSLLHASVVVVGVLLVRSCVPSRFIASRAGVGGVGLGCVLLVTVLTFLPLPYIGPISSSALPQADQTFSKFAKPPEATATFPSRTSGSETTVKTTASGLSIPVTWLHRISNSVTTSITTVDAAPRIFLNVFIAILLFGIAINLLRFSAALYHVHRLYKKSIVIADEGVARLLEEFQTRCNYRRKIELRESTELNSAATFGFLKPVILFPTAWRLWLHDELAAVLAHEVAHIRRHDFLQRLISQFCVALHCYHPLVKATARRLAIDQEYAADNLASHLQTNSQTYIRGLAKLALRFHDSFLDCPASLMPNSSDYLARRLQMLRTKEGSVRHHHTSLVTTCATLMIVVITLATALLYSSISLADKPKANSQSPRIASLPNATPSATQTSKSDRSASDADSAKVKSAVDQQVEPLFVRSPFDLSILQHADEGAALIRLGEILRHPDIAPLVDGYNSQLTNALRGWTKKNTSVDLRQVEWIAFCTTVTIKAATPDQNQSDKKVPDKDGPHGTLMLGAGYMYIRMAHAANWQQIVLDSVPGSTLETFEGHQYVHMPKITFLGPSGFRLRFPDDRTVVWACDYKPEDAEESNKLFFDDKPRTEPYAWESTWRGVEGGLITFVFDHTKDGWSKLPEPNRHQQECPEQVLPLVDEAKYYALGWDCTEKSRETGIKIRATCDDDTTVQKFYLAASLLLNRWPDLFQDSPKNLETYHTRLIQFFSGIKIQASPVSSDQHFIEMTGDAGLKEGELKLIAQQIFSGI